MIFKTGREFAEQIEIEKVNKLDIRIKIPKNEGIKEYPDLLGYKDFTEYNFNFKLKMRFSPLQIVNLIVKMEREHAGDVFEKLIISMPENSENPAELRQVFYFASNDTPNLCAHAAINVIAGFLADWYYIKPLKRFISIDDLIAEDTENAEK